MSGEAQIPTSLVGSYAQPNWLLDRERLRDRLPPRVRATELWRVDPRYLEEAQDDATLLAIGDQERAGLDIITDGEMRRESYSNRFATALDGVDVDNPGTALDRSGHPNPVPRVTGPIARRHPVQVRDPSGYSFLGELANTPCDHVSIETAQSGLDLEVLDQLPNKTIILGVLDLSTDEVETPKCVADRIRRAFPYVPASRLVAAPDCGMKYLSRGGAYGKLEALVQGARLAVQ